MKALRVGALALLAGLGGCVNSYGGPDPLASGLLGAGVGTVAGVAIAGASRPRDDYYYAPPPRRYYHGPPRGHHGYGPPRGYYGRGYGPPRHYGYVYGYGRRGW